MDYPSEVSKAMAHGSSHLCVFDARARPGPRSRATRSVGIYCNSARRDGPGVVGTFVTESYQDDDCTSWGKF